MIDRLTLATATGLPFVALSFHFATGLIGIVSGAVAIAARKGGTWHRKAGLVFVVAMIATGITATGIALYERNYGNLGGLLMAYFVVTAWTTVSPLSRGDRQLNAALTALALFYVIAGYYAGFVALGMKNRMLAGAPAGMIFFLSTVNLLAAIGDVRVMLAGIQGTRRLARHLWRMSFGLFIATGSFFIGQMKFIPKAIRWDPLLFALGVGPLVLLLYWMWRVRLRQNLRGLLTSRPIELPATG